MIVVGTAGHIDHGKSAIVKRLTGTDPDRLPEEKERGMTIDLGFAFYKTPDGRDIALVDVPGHERFVRNMIAGAGGIDAVMLVVAADDGWMPQSEEHFQITRLLGVKHGLIAINKTDLVESDWLALLEDEIRTKVKGTFLEQAPIIKLSAATGEGVDQLKAELNQRAEIISQRQTSGHARLAIDRSFVRPGMGGVVTGTLKGGNFKVGQAVSIWPSQEKAKIRTLQSNGQDTNTVTPGQRTAVSFTGIDREILVRGGVISDRTDLSFFANNPVLAMTFELLKQAPVAIEDRRRLLLIVGTTEIEGELRIFDRDQLQPGDSGIVFFRPDEPVYTLLLDHYIFRLPTPMVTVGGGMILDHLPAFPRRKNLTRYNYLNLRKSGNSESLLESELIKRRIADSNNLLVNADIAEATISESVQTLVQNGTLGSFENKLYHAADIDGLTSRLTDSLADYFQSNPHEKGLAADRIARLIDFDQDAIEHVLCLMLSQKSVAKEGELWNLPGRGIALKGVIKEAYEGIMAELNSDEFTPPALSELAAKGKVHQQAIKFILDSGEGYKCGSAFIFKTETWQKMVAYISATLAQSGQLKVSDLRDQFGLTRKYAIPILEETDRLRLTERSGDIRIKGDRFEK